MHARANCDSVFGAASTRSVTLAVVLELAAWPTPMNRSAVLLVDGHCVTTADDTAAPRAALAVAFDVTFSGEASVSTMLNDVW